MEGNAPDKEKAENQVKSPRVKKTIDPTKPLTAKERRALKLARAYGGEPNFDENKPPKRRRPKKRYQIPPIF